MYDDRADQKRSRQEQPPCPAAGSLSVTEPRPLAVDWKLQAADFMPLMSMTFSFLSYGMII
jgi:hypothetical protein